MECMKKKAREWQVRLSEEIKERADGRFTNTAGWTGNIEIRPYGNRNFKVGYENAVIHNLFIYTQPVTFYTNTANLVAIEGDI